MRNELLAKTLIVGISGIMIMMYTIMWQSAPHPSKVTVKKTSVLRKLAWIVGLNSRVD